MLEYFKSRDLPVADGPESTLIDGMAAIDLRQTALVFLTSPASTMESAEGLSGFASGHLVERSDALFSPLVDSLPKVGLQGALKRGLDIAFTATALFMLSPLLLAVALLIKADSRGPFLFRQTRIGLGNRPFQIYKFRTMTCCDDGLDVRQACRDDPRVTRVGRILRRSSIDELPQLLNVLVGTMSLVGPRPHAVAHHQQYVGIVAHYAERHVVRPGITGWAQVKGFRGATPDVDTMRNRVDHDLAYIKRWSVALDILILVMTVREIFRSENAY